MSLNMDDEDATQQDINATEIDASAANDSFYRNSTSDLNSIYTAAYSGTKVLETNIRGVSVMRRRNDSSFNATQILKVAGLDKSKRTKILEKEVHTGVHEKVQGGYGKFQGTWIPYDRAVALSQQYNVYLDLKDLFLYNVSSVEANDTPTKEQAVAAQRKKSGFQDSFNFQKQPSTLGRSYSTLTENDETELIDTSESPTKKQKLSPNTSHSIHGLGPDGNGKNSKIGFETYDHDLNIENPNTPFTLEPLSGFVDGYEHSKEVITQVFMSNDPISLAEAVGGESELAGVNLDVSIDESGHTALHWAASLARIPLVSELVSRGSIRIRGNNTGENPLIRSVLVTNNYDLNSFNELLNLLYPCIPLLDHQRRSILHHIVLTAGIKKRSAASRYYLETLLEWIVKTGTYLPKGGITLGKFMNEIVNAPDKNGDTCLNIAARIGNKAIVQQLLDVGADPSIPNRAGLRPIDFGINVNGLATAKQKLSTSNNNNVHANNLPGAFGDNGTGKSSTKILDSMQKVLQRLDTDFKSEINTKQEQIDELHSKLRESTLKLSKSRQNLETLKQSEIKLNELKQKISNLDKATQEEEQKFLSQTTDLGSVSNHDIDFDADEPFRVWPIFEKLKQDPNQQVDPRSINLQEIPPSVVLKARITAYKENENILNKVIENLRSNSDKLEDKFRRVVALCTGVEEDTIDSILDGLVQAVESDPDEVDMGRVVGFLRRVDDKLDV
ncbi:putative regulatory protein [Wickerhamomyces ciferrii]|uniref:Regulatory protein n=1 Tax=Wickerhamomyces ciferrii (strain ATCC 14091 / BCRC 22168 / CBS 111 / JCM 3599 / NBRC 0793 / NRRL Y-1031 F-60-10) TaxID=1206466 RepID=K0KNX6_WICCF|nr:putative regulatory protein [Wickerhamomyces ciferrii]CCH43882.1 putative regulatory protein [Wickerhamomyces ciferrii]